MVSTSGAQLLPHEAIKHMSQHLLPHTTLLTPNIPEAELLLRENGQEVPPVNSVADLEALARTIRTSLGPRWVLVKGGHVPFGEDLRVASAAGEGSSGKKYVVDVLFGGDADEVVRVQAPWQESSSTHGTGCSLACEFGCAHSFLGSSFANRNDPSCHLGQLGTWRGYALCCEGGVSIRRGWDSLGAEAGWRPWPAGPLSLDDEVPLCAVSTSVS